MTFNEDNSYSVLNDTLLSHVYDVDTPLDEIVFTLTSDRLSVEEVERLCEAATPDATARGGHKEGLPRLTQAVADVCFSEAWLLNEAFAEAI